MPSQLYLYFWYLLLCWGFFSSLCIPLMNILASFPTYNWLFPALSSKARKYRNFAVSVTVISQVFIIVLSTKEILSVYLLNEWMNGNKKSCEWQPFETYLGQRMRRQRYADISIIIKMPCCHTRRVWNMISYWVYKTGKNTIYISERRFHLSKYGNLFL